MRRALTICLAILAFAAGTAGAADPDWIAELATTGLQLVNADLLR